MGVRTAIMVDEVDAFIWPAPAPIPPQHAWIFVQLEQWVLVQQGGSRVVFERIVGLLDRDYLLSIPWDCQGNGDNPRGVRLRYLFRRIVAHLLRWTKRRSASSANGFPSWLDDALRSSIYPDQ